MRICWRNVFGFPLAIFGLVWGLMMHDKIGIFFSSIESGALGYYPHEQIILGFLTLIMVIMSIIALVTIFFCNGRNQ